MTDNITITVTETVNDYEVDVVEGIEDAPVDGSVYGRLNSLWTSISGGVNLWTRNALTATVSPSATDDNIDAGDGYITGKKSGVFAYLPFEADTTCTLADTWYPIAGTFTNNPMEDFSLGSSYIVYDGTKTQYFEIDAHATVSSNTNGTKAHFGIKINGVLLSGSVMGLYAKTSDEPYPVSGTSVVELSTSDTVQFVVKSSASGSVITFIHLTATIAEFFD